MLQKAAVYQSRLKPWSWQKEGLQKMRGRPAFALLMAMRTGKTKTLLDDWAQLLLDGHCNDLLVIAPAGVYRTWEKAIKEHLAEELLVRVEVFTWSAKMGRKSDEKLERFMSSFVKQRILLINVEALSVVDRARMLALKFCMQRSVMIAVDESTSIKNPSAKRTKFLNRVLKPNSEYRRILSGLPTPKSPLDLYSQFEFLDKSILGNSNYRAFRARYGIIKRMTAGGRSFDVVVGYRDVDQLQELIAPHSHRVLLENCYDLPAKMYTIREVEMTADQRRIYRELKEFATAKLEDEKHISAPLVITQILRMHQVLCGHTVTEDGRPVEIAENRTGELLKLLEEHDGKAVIWCSYDRDIRKVSEALEEAELEEGQRIDPANLKYVARFWGGNRSTREQEEHKFLTDPQCRYMVATAAAGGRGRTWTNADLVVYYSNTPDLEHRAQSEERAQGVGKTRSTLYVDLVVPGTVDMKMLDALRKKINMSNAITGDAWREWVV